MANIPYSRGMTYQQYCSGLKSLKMIDSFTQIDEKVDFCGSKMDEIQTDLSSIKDSMEEGLDMIVPETTQIKFKETLTALTGDKFTYICPWNATNIGVAMHFPSGCNALVDVAIGHSDKQIYPRSGYISLNDASPVFSVSEDIANEELIWVEINNADGGNSHTITVILTLQRRI